MAQAGIPVPAGEVRLPLFGRVLADIGEQAAEQFSACVPFVPDN
jgi:dsDNA-specific endonuclease/ATPase MutS2